MCIIKKNIIQTLSCYNLCHNENDLLYHHRVCPNYTHHTHHTHHPILLSLYTFDRSIAIAGSTRCTTGAIKIQLRYIIRHFCFKRAYYDCFFFLEVLFGETQT